ncbi:MAG TPA: primosomal protein N' [Dissulfurispiraceae bacterium]|nr:primosomal protein N' [Dissulfurispiraceae bacterium]
MTSNSLVRPVLHYVCLDMLVDVVFPLRLSPLTYRVPEGLPHDITGRIVKAPLMHGSRFGLAVDVRMGPGDESIKIKELLDVHDTFASATHLKFLKWLSEYYLSPAGLALKSSFFEEAVSQQTDRRKSKKVVDSTFAGSLPEISGMISPAVVSGILNRVKACSYSALVYHAQDLESEYATLFEMLRQLPADLRGIVVLVPETGFIKKAATFLEQIFGQRLVVLHSKLGKNERAESIKKIISGNSDVILGTRSAMLAPLPHASFIVVIEEQNRSYKGEEGLRYNARDLAVMRAFIDKSCVLLSSICPSIETDFNIRKGKYVQLAKISLQSSEKRPRIKIVTFRTKKQSELSLSSEVINEAGNLLQKKERVLFLVGRKGYSLIRCEDCGHIESCGNCSIPMIFYKSIGMLKCHHCGHERRSSESCGECGSQRIRPFSAGTERVMEDVREALKTPALLVQKARISSPPAKEFNSNNPGLSDFAPFVIGTSLAKRKVGVENKFSAAVLMNIDLLLAQPDFRAYEHAFQEIIEVSQMVKREGSLLIQTKSPGSKVLKCMKHYDFETFADLELSQRKDLDYPPYSRLVLFSVFGKAGGTDLTHLWRVVRSVRDDAVSIFGPVEVPSASKAYGQCHHILLKSRDSRKLHEMAKTLLSGLECDKRIKVVVDVDPLKI